MSAVLRAGGGLRSRRPGHLGRPRRRRLGGQRPEGLDQPRAPGQLGSAAGPHRSRRAQAQGADLLRAGHARAGRRDAAAAATDRARRVQRGVHHRCPHPRCLPPRRGGRRLAGRHDDVDERTQRPRRQRQPTRGGHHRRRRRAVGGAARAAHSGVARPAHQPVAARRGATPDLGAVPGLGDGRRTGPGGFGRQTGRRRTQPAHLRVLHGSARTRGHHVRRLRGTATEIRTTTGARSSSGSCAAAPTPSRAARRR